MQWFAKTRLTLNSSVEQYTLLANNTQNLSSLSVIDKLTTSNEEISSNFRYQRFCNPVFRYEYKTGNYFPKNEIKLFPGLLTTASEITGGLRMSS